MIVMIIRKSDTTLGEWLLDTEGYAVEFKTESQINAQINLMKQSDPTIISYIID